MTEPSAHASTTVVGSVTVEIDKVDGSRFIGDLCPTSDEDAAFRFVADVRLREPSATHHCWAFRLDSGVSRSSDDGEPAGTAGPPMLRRLESADLVDVVAVVTRYYGGTNLGTGGLIRAYGAATAAAIDAATTVTRRRMVRYRFVHPYELTAQVHRVLAAHEAEIVEALYDEAVTVDAQVPAATAPAFEAFMLEATAGIVNAYRIEA